MATALKDEQDDEPFDPVECALADYDHAVLYYEPWNTRLYDELEFCLEIIQYEADTGGTRDRGAVQPHDLSLLNLARRNWSQVSAAPIYLQTHAVNQDPQDTDTKGAERTKWALEREIYAPRKGYKKLRRRMLIGGFSCGLWWMRAQWNEKLQEILYDLLEPAQVNVAPGWKDHHDPTCPFVTIYEHLTYSQLEERAKPVAEGGEGWTIPESLNPTLSPISPGASQSTANVRPGQVKLSAEQGNGTRPGVPRRDVYGVITVMYREDPEGAYEAQENEPVKLTKEQRFMACDTCGYETTVHPRDVEGDLPMVGDPCPKCTARLGEDHPDIPNLERQDEMSSVTETDVYANGRKIVILEDTEDLLFDGDWGFTNPKTKKGLDSFPLMGFRSYEDPRFFHGYSDTYYNYTGQLLASATLRMGFEQMANNVDILISPLHGLVDSKLQPFRHRAKQGRIAYLKDPSQADSLHHFQGSGLPQGWQTLYQSLQGSFQKNLGTGELGLGEQATRNIPVGTVRAIQESGEIPTDDHIAVLRDEEGSFLHVVAQMIQCKWTEPRWVRYLGADGKMAYDQFMGSDLSDVDVMITADPSLKAIRTEEADVVEKWMAAPPFQRRTMAKLLGIDSTIVTEYEADEQKAMQDQKPQTDPTKLITAVASMVKDAPHMVYENQVQAVLVMAGLPAGQGNAVGPSPQVEAITQALGRSGNSGGKPNAQGA